ncbi:multicopper oxidase domain-containing protein [Breoghania sp. L-A4]|uniref:multicopper oxidase family protein n=1 Tax=Breoghania sp. L-A4 TaxID=2304600 RepID=UPI0020BEA1E6|nr:multicopper oxidase domain-containing protein [Breoghania sp. L-A4]
MSLAPTATALSREVELEMNILYADRKIYNPSKGGKGGYDAVSLRTYEDARAGSRPGPDAPLVGPTIPVHPGQTVRLTLNNQLPADSTCGIGSGGSVNVPHCFNGTNMHTHGLWVNPSGNGDNVLISIRPGVSFQYEYNIPPDHPAGTFWYHPHLHGSTALQVSNGMAGALIIRADRKPTLEQNGDLDSLLVEDGGQPVPERVLVLQQIQYACRGEDGKIQYKDPENEIGYVCEPGQVGTIEGYDQFGPGSWPKSGRYTSINGVVLGEMTPARVGVPERWRWIHAGVRDTINVELRHKTGGEAYRTLAAEDSDSWIERNCGEAIDYNVVAQDGLTMAAVQRRSQAVLQPGYRVDALVVLPEAGEYCVVDAAAPSAGTVNQAVPSRKLLGVVTAAGGGPADSGSEDYIKDWLIEAAQRTMPAGIVDEVVRDLEDGLQLSRFVPHPSVEEGEVTGTQTLVFNIDVSQPDGVFFEIDGKPYDPNRIDRTLPVGGVDEWTLTSDFVSHPYHIHVNPFQIVSIIGPDGVDVSELDAKDPSPDGPPDQQYPGLKGVWKDTLWVKNSGSAPGGKYTITMRTRYQRYIGDFVLHCHILDHEDQGMMQNIRIALPDGAGGTAYGHH